MRAASNTMAEIRVASYPQGLVPPARLEVSLGVRSDEDGRPARFTIDWIDEAGDTAFHFNPQPDTDVVVLSSYIDGVWGPGIQVAGCPFRHEPEASHVLFEVDEEGFEVSIDGEPYATFAHRVPPSRIRRVLSSRDLWRVESLRLPTAGQPGAGSAFLPELHPTPESWEGYGWVQTAEGPTAERLDDFRLYAVLGTWLEEDVVEAAVAGAFAQGCEAVHLVDNGSDDRTVERAVRAGATLALTFETPHYEEDDRVRRMQGVVDEVSAASGADHVWWLWLDADEFHHGPGGLTLREHLASLDAGIRVVGSRYFNHYPDRRRAYGRRRHPLDYQPLCYELRLPWYCDRGHWKHPLQRWDLAGPQVSGRRGFHTAASADPLLEAATPIFTHHFPYRSRRVTQRRLRRFFDETAGPDRGSRDSTGSAHMRMRAESLRAVYAQRWNDVRFFPPCALGYAPELRPFEQLVGPRDAAVARWYRRWRA